MASTICLNMIVKNEAPVIRRCLASVRPIIDSWVIVDTGSTDGTQEIIREALADLPGRLIERPWVDFAHNRSEALTYARGAGDYVFVIDADEVLEIDEGFEMPQLTEDAYNLEIRYGGYSYLRKQLVRNTLPWRYEGVLHEYICCDEARTEAFLPGLHTTPHHDGARARDPLTYRRDALVLEKALLDDPENTRYVFYLAQSYRDAGDLEQALRHYRRRIEMGGWTEEVWYAHYQVAQLQERLGHPWAEVMEAYLTAFQYKPDRAGPLYRIGLHYQARKEYHTAHLFFGRAMQIPYPSHDRLFIEQQLYTYLLPVEYAVACFYVGDHTSAIDTSNRMLRSGVLPPHAVEQVIKNRRFSLDARFPAPQTTVVPGRLRVCVPFHDPGPELDDGIEALLLQTSDAFQVTFIDDGSTHDHRDRLPLEDDRFGFIRHAEPCGFDACLEAFVHEHARPGDLILPLSPTDRLASPDTLNHLGAGFEDPDCKALYGQYRTADGTLGHAEPIPHAEALNERDDWSDQSPVAFRAEVLSDGNSILQSAGFDGIRFSDEVFTITGLPALPQPTAASHSSLPLISCLMVTYDRLALAKRAIRCYLQQTYPNRELVIVTDGPARFIRALERFIAPLDRDDIRLLDVGPERSTLGRLRNLSMDAAHGELLCQWDDDDCYHPDRLRVQAEHLRSTKARACFLTDQLQFLEAERALLWIDWTADGQLDDHRRLIPGTLMMHREDRFRYPETGAYARQGEDSVLMESLYAERSVAALSGQGHLYLYQYHGRNTFSQAHHYQMRRCAFPAAHLQAHADQLRQALAHYPIPKPVIVVGRDGPAYALM